MSEQGAEVPKVYKCKYCKVQVRSKSDPRAVLGREHKKGCRRRNLL